jgi:hypothetical protein
MKYDATAKELCMIEDGEVNKSSDSGYIICTINGMHHYLTVNGEVTVGPKLKDGEAYHNSFDIAKEFFAKWVKDKELQEEIKIKNESIIEKMSHIEFKLAIKEF